MFRDRDRVEQQQQKNFEILQVIKEIDLEIYKKNIYIYTVYIHIYLPFF